MLRNHPDGAGARDYLAKRGITPDLIEKFGLGYAPDRWDALVQFLGSRGYGATQIVDAGLGIRKKSGDGLLDRFRHRVMIPLHDAVGNIVGFTARTIGPGQTVTPVAPKYMNSPESPVYSKGRVLYGLHLAKTGIRTAKCVIVVEGNLDVVSSHKAGVEHIVASSGTALTEEQLKILSRYTKRIVFALDEDAAGFAAARRALEIARTKFPELEIRCLIIPRDAGKDPDEVVQKDPEAWRRIAQSSKEIVEFMFDRQLKAYEARSGSATIEERRALVDELVGEIARIPRSVDRHLYLLRLSDATHVAVEVLEREVAKRAAPSTPKTLPPSHPPTPHQKKQTKEDRAAEFVIGLMLADDGVAAEILDRVPETALPAEPWRRLYTMAKAQYTSGQIAGATNQSLYSRLQSDVRSRGADDDLRRIDATLLRLEEQVRGWSPDMVRAELDQHIALLKGALGDQRRKELEAAIRAAELSQSASLNALLAEYAQLLRILGK
ncbi:toprim domain-containing protein [Candidatus Uhrbacteria bacterium]|nr:toprim domain-containing protein [Candidatus Uhrbacteria bacterium]